MKQRIRPRIISKFYKGEKGKCVECNENFPLEEMCLLATTWFDGNIIGFDLYCSECFDWFSEGDDKAWREAI